MSEQNQFSEWCLLELMGHQRIAGLISEATIGGVNLLRVDVPEVKGIAGYTRYFSGSAVYSLNPVTEKLAKQMAEGLRVAPIQRYELPKLEQAVSDDDEDGPWS